jgi:hypothetical protein
MTKRLKRRLKLSKRKRMKFVKTARQKQSILACKSQDTIPEEGSSKITILLEEVKGLQQGHTKQNMVKVSNNILKFIP